MTTTDSTVREGFNDPMSGKPCALVIPPDGRIFVARGSDKPKIGVAHADCEALADLTIELHAWYCPACKLSGRISGAWAHSRIMQAMPDEF